MTLVINGSSYIPKSHEHMSRFSSSRQTAYQGSVLGGSQARLLKILQDSLRNKTEQAIRNVLGHVEQLVGSKTVSDLNIGFVESLCD